MKSTMFLVFFIAVVTANVKSQTTEKIILAIEGIGNYEEMVVYPNVEVVPGEYVVINNINGTNKYIVVNNNGVVVGEVIINSLERFSWNTININLKRGFTVSKA